MDGAENGPVWVVEMSVEAGRLLGLVEPLVLPAALIEGQRGGADFLLLDGAALPAGPFGPLETEFQAEGSNGPAIFSAYSFSRYMPGAWPVGMDGSGGFYCLDLRGVATGSGPNDGTAPLVWVHAGNLGWESDCWVLVAADSDAFFRTAVVARSCYLPWNAVHPD
ncbi:hypothetical protein [Phycicoccus avicenniae]|uniref:hypothetical protein n=1 Tax=Phycicoccus avicenniae TaxID=2828860 RepID=UPI003D2CAD91